MDKVIPGLSPPENLRSVRALRTRNRIVRASAHHRHGVHGADKGGQGLISPVGEAFQEDLRTFPMTADGEVEHVDQRRDAPIDPHPRGNAAP